MIKFIHERKNDGFYSTSPETEITHIITSTDITLPELLEQFALFIKGIGYSIPENAELDFVNWEDDLREEPLEEKEKLTEDLY